MRYITPALLAIAVAQGCASTSPETKAAEPDPVRYGIERRASAAHQVRELVGAAYVGEGYRHMLVYGTRRYSTSKAAGASDLPMSDADDAGTRNAEITKPSSNTDSGSDPKASNGQELVQALWEKYCDAGVNMSDVERTKLEDLRSEHPMPAELADSCAPPK